MANPERGEIDLDLAGELFVLRPTFDALRRLEAETGKGLVQLVTELRSGAWRLTDLVTVIKCGIAGGGGTPPADLGQRIVEASVVSVSLSVAQFLSAALTGKRVSDPGSDA